MKDPLELAAAATYAMKDGAKRAPVKKSIALI